MKTILVTVGVLVLSFAIFWAFFLPTRRQMPIDTTVETQLRSIADAFKRRAVQSGGKYESGDGPHFIQALTEAWTEAWTDEMGEEQLPLLEFVPHDAWKHEFLYSYDPAIHKTPLIWSLGPNGLDDQGKEDDRPLSLDPVTAD